MQHTLNPGDILYQQGDRNDCAFLVAEGEVGLYRTDTGTTKLIDRRGAGSLVGESSIILGKERAVTAKAETACTLFRIPADRILRQFDSLDPVLSACINTTISFVEALYNSESHLAVQQGENHSEIHKVIQRLQTEHDLTVGLERGEFHVVYQPIVEVSSGQIAGFEALMRWTHPENGPMRPDHFIAIAEDISAIWNITVIAIVEACRTLRLSRDTLGRDLFASINISARDLARHDFVDFLANVLDQYDLAPDCIKLELTESALVSKNAMTETNLERLRQLGLGISVDDFGTGYSNLGHLQLLPIKTLKIDKSFADGVHASNTAKGIVRMLVALGNELNVDIVAEGIESAIDVSVLEALGCRYVQGFFFFKPMAQDDLLKALTQQAAEVA